MASKLSTLSDFFAGASLNTALWNANSGTPVLDTTLDRVQLPCTSSYTILGSGLWDATSSSLSARIQVAPLGNGSTETILELHLDANNRANMFVSGGSFFARVTNAGVASTTALPTYSSYTHAWWRIVESAGQFVFSTSADGFNWTQQASIPYSWSATALTVQVACGYFGTESAGMSGYVDHVNTMQSDPSQINLNWPLAAVGWGAQWNANAGGVPRDRYVSVTSRTRDGISVGRGRQYELDQPQAGTFDVTLANTDAALDPTNSSGPFAGHIAPYQPLRARMQWPPTRNLLTQVQATGGDLGGFALGAINATVSGPMIFSSTDSTNGSFVSSASAWQGSTVMQFSVPTSATIPSFIVYTGQVEVEPGVTYSQQLQARDVTASSSVQVAASIQWLTASNATISTVTGTAATLTGSTTAGWSQFTVSGTAPSNAAAMLVGLRVTAVPSATCNVQVDGWQFEVGASASSWCCPGVWYPVYGGFSERWPSEWILSGTYGRVHPTGVDALALLSQTQLSDPLTEEISYRSPRFVYTLGDPSGSTTFADQTGNYPAAKAGTGKYGAGTLTAGNAITSVSPTGGFIGSGGTIVTITNPNPGASTTSAASFINLSGAGIYGPAGNTVSRMIAFRYAPATFPAAEADVWAAIDTNHGVFADSEFRLFISAGNGNPSFITGNWSAGLGGTNQVSVNVADGNWHLAIFGYTNTGGLSFLSIDGAYQQLSAPTGMMPTGIVSDCIGGLIDGTLGYSARYNFSGDVSFAAEFPTYLAASDCTALYSAWKSACSGESSGARYSRILRYASYSGTSSIQAGQSTSLGPATDIAGASALSALQAVVDTENGEHFVDASGTVTFRGRGARYNALTPVYTFGENAAGGEWPYEAFTADLDSTHLSNVVTVTQTSSGQDFKAQDATSQTAYFQRTLTRSNQSTSTGECQDAADYLLSRYRQPATRVSGLTLHPSANPAMWPVCLSLELGMRVRVMRRPPGVPATQLDVFVEQINWAWDDQGDATVSLLCSPADLTPYGIFASFHTTLNASIASGVTSIVIKNGQDNTNPAAAQLTGGQQLVLGQNTANQETVTIATGGVGATSSGWTTCTIQLTAATTKSHTAGDIVCEPLPAGVTDPTTWDAVSQFDSTAFSY